MTLAELQSLMERTYGTRDRARGAERTFLWLVEEVGELAEALRHRPEDREAEMADVLAWLLSLANVCGVDVTRAMEKYSGGCPRCSSIPCGCPPA